MESVKLLLLFSSLLMMTIMPQVSALRYMVGGNMGWSPSVNYTLWAKGKQFYLGDWLFFVYDRNQMNVLEVNQTDYESCNSDHPLVNWTGGAGRDVVPLNVTKHRYFISGKGFCYGGMKLAINVEKPPPPPSAAPIKSYSSSMTSYHSHVVVPVAFALAAAWDSLLHVAW
ncbi:hypothetical protein Ancab_034211 [Ancistrocladus abbreviatus]